MARSFLDLDDIRHSLEALDSSKSPRTRSLGNEDTVNIGDLVICSERARLREAFYDYLRSNGFALLPEEEDYLRFFRNKGGLYGRPCVLLDRTATGSFLVCFLATFMDAPDNKLGGHASTELYVPQSAIRFDLPWFRSRAIFGLPVERSPRSMKPIWPWLHVQLEYGDHERIINMVRDKVAYFKANHETIRKAEARLLYRWRTFQRRTPVQQKTWGDGKKIVLRPPGLEAFLPKPPPRIPTRSFPKPYFANHNIRWLLRARSIKQEAFHIWRYPPPSMFRLPSPFYSKLLRASTTFVRRRILG
ncbi:hypothetical protein B0H16DRAFT_1689173 [Mycena metata]|uniref:Uncharacterized protein n=1 Tax=Mycena metata TaxID=1033252 RepID=A0AAD7JAW5_9AGAR|nr:hypothetical protein B0H16DRAFT_1689173 [Mycena metata]